MIGHSAVIVAPLALVAVQVQAASRAVDGAGTERLIQTFDISRSRFADGRTVPAAQFLAEEPRRIARRP